MAETKGLQAWAQRYKQARIAHWNFVARKRDRWRSAGRWYHNRLREIYRFLVSPGQKVLEIGCGTGDLLAGLQPARGVGIDFSPEMIARAASRYPSLEFIEADAHDLSFLNETFDFIILSDTVNDLWDVQTVLEQLRSRSTPRTRLVLNFYSGLWQLPLGLAQKLSLAAPLEPQNWLTQEDVRGMLALAGFEPLRSWHEILWPLPLGGLANRVLVRLAPFHLLALSNFIVARPQPRPVADPPTVSVIIPARNEAGNIRALLERIPRMGRHMELIFVEGHSRDDTYQAIEQAMHAFPELPIRLLRQVGEGKADAVRTGFSQAQGDILMILDADMTVAPEDLPRFYQALVSGKAEFVNGVRLVYPMEHQAMRFLNFLGNKLFSLAFSWLLGQPIKDTLCGSKALWRADYERIAAGRSAFGECDPFGDFDLLFGAAKLHLKIVDLPIRYRERTYGVTNISRWKHGWLLLRMLGIAARRLKFV